MRRRDFIAGLGGAAALPFAARARQAMPIIGVLRSSTEADGAHMVLAFRDGLKQAGLTEGQDFVVEVRHADNSAERLRALVAELARRPVAMIVGDNNAALVAKASTALPIIFASGGDPVKNGLVPSLNRPGGTVTGVVFLTGVLGAKRLELLRQLVPKAATVAVLTHPGTPTTDAERRDLQATALTAGQNLLFRDVKSDSDAVSAFGSFAAEGVGAALVGSGPFLNSYGRRIVDLAAQHRLPVMYPQREHVVAGGLMSYGTSTTDAYRQAAKYAVRILKGEKPGDLPVVQSSKFEFVINLKNAKALGLEFHPQLLGIVDEVIE
jgi:putative ABC transport system substrate-binding protein